ncbi:MAG: helix-turn-helix domain-containing protein [Ruminococcaceae bacterium]|nr:helix-turn-helix domain-containing protein [Oscillospiraceae bacterium]
MEYKLKRFCYAITVSKIANLHYFEFTNQFHTEKESHAFCELLYVDSGFITVDADNYQGIVRENQVIVHKSNEPHSLSCPEDEASNVIIIGFACDNRELDVFSEAPVTLNESQKKLLTEIIREGRNVFEAPYDIPGQKDMKKRKEYPFGADQLIKIKLENLFIELIRSKNNVFVDEPRDISDDKIQEVLRYLNENFKEKIKLSELCFLFGTNATTLCNKFRDAYGETIISYINKRKIKEAKRLMRSGSYNLTEIASIVGFSSVHYFSRIFKQYEKQAPTAYLKTIKARLMM